MWRLFPRRIRAKSSLTDRLYVGSLPRKIFKIFWTKWRWSWTIRGNKTSNTHGIQACLHQTPAKRRPDGNLALVKFFSRANSLEGSEMNYGCRWPLSSASQVLEKFLSFLVTCHNMECSSSTNMALGQSDQQKHSTYVCTYARFQRRSVESRQAYQGR